MEAVHTDLLPTVAALDVGNTRIKIGFFQERSTEPKEVFRFSDWTSVMEMLSEVQLEGIILCHSGAFTSEMETQLSQLAPLMILDAKTPVPIQNMYDTPHTLGKDRLAAAIGAHCLYPSGTKIIIDAGTCITMDVVDQEGRFLGGNISPGIQMKFKAMHTFTAALPQRDYQFHAQFIGTNTSMAIENGVVYGTISEIQSFIERVQQNFHDVKVIFTGGDTINLVEYIKGTIFVHPNLVLIGLNEIYLFNAKIR